MSEITTYKKYMYFTVLTLFFTVVIFFVKSFFFGNDSYENTHIEEKYIEPVVVDVKKEKKTQEKGRKIGKDYSNTGMISKKGNLKNDSGVDLENIGKKQLSALQGKKERAIFGYIPSNFGDEKVAQLRKESLNLFYMGSAVYPKIDLVDILLYQKLKDVRGRMKNKKIHLYDVANLPEKELFAVHIHEFAHFFDLYILKKTVYKDISDYFYYISWESTRVKSSGQSVTDFVSGYAMTNKYEDFAESFTYYVLHNDDFLEKAKKSILLQRKYDFFRNFVFKNGEFQNIGIKTTKKVKKYYRDTTKIDYDLEKLYIYLKK